MGAFLQRLLHFVSSDAETHQHVYTTMGCCSTIRIEEDHAQIPHDVKDDGSSGLDRQQAAHLGHRQ